MATKSAEQEDYGVDSIQVLKGLEPVKLRPGMYTLTDTPLHIIQEVMITRVTKCSQATAPRLW